MLDDNDLWLIASATEGASWYLDVLHRLEAEDDPDESLRPAIFAFGFHFLEPDTEGRGRHRGAWGPMVEMGGQRFPPPLESLDDEVVAVWAQMLEAVDQPPVRARCGDLVWVRKHGPRPHEAARSAIQGYVDLGQDDGWSPMERAEGLARALELARELNDDELVTRVASAMSAAADHEMSSGEDRPGLTLRFLQPLVRLPSGLRPAQIEEQLKAADDRYGADPYIAESVAESLRQLAAPEERREIERRMVRRWMDEADRGDALLGMLRLQQALELALSSGLKEEADEIRRLMAEVSPDELDLKRVETEVPFPRDRVDAFIEEVSKLELREALRLFGSQGPPTGDPTESEEAAAKLLRDHPLMGLFPRAVLGEVYPSVVFKADTPERHQRLEAAQYRARAATVWAVIASSIADALFAAHEPTKGDLDTALETTYLSRGLEEKIARAFELYALEQHDECVHVLVPRIEAALRELAAAAGIPVIVPPRGEEPGGVASLGAVLSALKGPLDEGWRVYLHTVLTDRLALNLRNTVAHGTRPSFGRMDAALLVHITCFLISLNVTTPEPPAHPH